MTRLIIRVSTVWSWAREDVGSVTRFSLLPIVRSSLIVHYTWQAIANHWKNEIVLKTLEIQRSYEGGARFYPVDDALILELATSQWENYHRLIHHIAVNEGILDIHLLQPSPYVKNSKVLTKQEKEKSKVGENNWYNQVRDAVVRGYPRLRARLSELPDSGIIAKDLSYIYRDIKESIWIDAAHPNGKGYEIVLDGIAEIVQTNKSHINQNRD